MLPIDSITASAAPLETSIWVSPGLVWHELLATASLIRRGLRWFGGILLTLTLLLAILIRPDWQLHAALSRFDTHFNILAERQAIARAGGLKPSGTAYNQYLQQFISISWSFSYFLNQAARNAVAPGAVAH